VSEPRELLGIAEATYDVEAQFLDAGNEALLGEVGIRINNREPQYLKTMFDGSS